jgi:hypothetical protein
VLLLPVRHHWQPAGPPIHVRRTRGQETAARRRTVEAESPGGSGRSCPRWWCRRPRAAMGDAGGHRRSSA